MEGPHPDEKPRPGIRWICIDEAIDTEIPVCCGGARRGVIGSDRKASLYTLRAYIRGNFGASPVSRLCAATGTLNDSGQTDFYSQMAELVGTRNVSLLLHSTDASPTFAPRRPEVRRPCDDATPATYRMISRRVARQSHARKHMNNLAHTKANKHCGGRGFEKIIIPILNSRNTRVRIVPGQSAAIVLVRS
ncbi:hypothetical protein J6590_021162 [Homalodisca vitripennis]|nr:hypothetical protein J6590_021162 [Homalodisca vitripennis]